ncbi:NAD(P)-dependent oxidoreductase [Priestia aryabhattai]|uniref:prephenate dehydrogenase/arogenate dehydrogenase family protein n=1 Tax=Priestia TaxID=2800373 RepID=UPI0007ABEAB0|nr:MULTISPECIES: prephenate dehydrogenase/arogenate dehydrogenase family protein [Priestia]KZE15234.1 3-hydroxyisobutyrate dehydrogenase [Priestia aryabhattai]MBY0004127.1 NAD(P)-dependent oxidoreductase [Priestia aryabhattai]MBY0046588.1 NAD(P)-dependent oxidoreductase [Priestia aryabhattai]MDE8672716.1 prephenate dehydrogenase/arogenate dehydrogenase family protein [Priestia aryabhattai]MED4389579.1 prephenate dehydrogenase/arogenate dehydrogenase family protein [Priestia aryabhattai]
MKLGFIGFGEAAFELSVGLKGEGLETIFAHDVMIDHPTYGPQIKERAAQAQVELLYRPEEVLKQVDIVIVAVPADKALEVSEMLKPFIKKGCIYVDVSASTPIVKQKIDINIQEKNAFFVDAAMLGPLPVYKHKVPISASGNGVDRLISLMTPYSMDITKVSEKPGDASAVKLIRSIYMKGVVALYLELLEASHEFNVEQLVLDSISETLDSKSFRETMNRLVTGTSIHALRRSIELDGSIQMLEASNLNSVMSRAAKSKLETLASFNLKEKFKGQKPDHWLDVIKACKEDAAVNN